MHRRVEIGMEVEQQHQAGLTRAAYRAQRRLRIGGVLARRGCRAVIEQPQLIGTEEIRAAESGQAVGRRLAREGHIQPRGQAAQQFNDPQFFASLDGEQGKVAGDQ